MCDCPGFSSFLVTFFFSFHKEKKKVTEKFEIKEELNLKVNLVLSIIFKLADYLHFFPKILHKPCNSSFIYELTQSQVLNV